MSEIDLLEIDSGTVVAPAGCGKTHSIATSLKHDEAKKPVLVLTHTNSGVAALREKLDREGVRRSNYRLATIDGWAMRLISTFPQRAGHDPKILELTEPKLDYPNIRAAGVRLLKSENIQDVIASSYSRIFVDEYQGCSIQQHTLVFFAAKVVPTCALGDPLQAIFGFGDDPLANWSEDVCKHFPIVGELRKPWRWINANSEALGNWLLETRGKLLAGEHIDLKNAPQSVRWVELDGSASDFPKLLDAARERSLTQDGCVVIIGDSINAESRYRIASAVAGAVTVEAVDLRDLISFSRDLALDAPDALNKIASFAQSVMANVGAADLVRRVETLMRGGARRPPSQAENAAIAFRQSPSHRGVINLLVEIGREGGVRTYRPGVLRACISALHRCNGNDQVTFNEAAILVREQGRFQGRQLPKRAIGSTLLLKGLEADVSVVLNAGQLDARNLYVAMTRGSKKLTLCSQSSVLNPRRT